MASSENRRDPDTAERLYKALWITLATFVEAESIQDRALVQVCGEFLSTVLARVSVQRGDTDEEVDARIALYTRTLEERIRHYIQQLRTPEPQ